MTFVTIGIFIALQIIVTVAVNLLLEEDKNNVVGIFGAITLLLTIVFITYRLISILKKDNYIYLIFKI